ncbi:hypothetical protein EV361DRAFT_955981 [Lentinula raphanica]|nr:hypothetical protein EV361DRAFT_955981 [Lentinula raphanica]
MNGDSQHADNVSISSDSAQAMETQESQRPASPDGWPTGSTNNMGWGRAGFGLYDAGWSGDPPSNRHRHISNSSALQNLRTDFDNAHLTFEGTTHRDTGLDHLETKIWATVQSYRSSDEARQTHCSYPSFTGAQEQETLVKEVAEASSTLSTLQSRKKQVSTDIHSLRQTQRELEALKEIAYARLL